MAARRGARPAPAAHRDAPGGGAANSGRAGRGIGEPVTNDQLLSFVTVVEAGSLFPRQRRSCSWRRSHSCSRSATWSPSLASSSLERNSKGVNPHAERGRVLPGRQASARDVRHGNAHGPRRRRRAGPTVRFSPTCDGRVARNPLPSWTSPYELSSPAAGHHPRSTCTPRMPPERISTVWCAGVYDLVEWIEEPQRIPARPRLSATHPQHAPPAARESRSSAGQKAQRAACGPRRPGHLVQ